MATAFYEEYQNGTRDQRDYSMLDIHLSFVLVVNPKEEATYLGLYILKFYFV